MQPAASASGTTRPRRKSAPPDRSSGGPPAAPVTQILSTASWPVTPINPILSTTATRLLSTRRARPSKVTASARTWLTKRSPGSTTSVRPILRSRGSPIWQPPACMNRTRRQRSIATKYKGKFDAGWDKYREETFSRQKRLGVVPADAKLPPLPKEVPAWESLSQDTKRIYARMMENYSAYLEYTDAQIGRVIDAIAAKGQLDNTLIIYIVGDNGASAEGGLEG